MAQGSIKKRHLAGGRVRWDVVVDLGNDPVTGKRRQRKKTFMTKREAQAGLAGWLAEIDKGTVVERSAQTLGDLMTFWLRTHRPNVRAKTYAGYEDTVRLHILPTLGAVRVQKLTPSMLQGFYNDKLAAGCGARTLRLCHIHISQALNLAVKQGLVARNVADSVTPPRYTPKEMATWDADQARQFLSVAHRSSHGPLWIVALATGMRRGEVLGLRWKDVDFERGVLRVWQTVGVLHGVLEIKAPKTRSSRREIRVPAAVIELLREHKRRQNERRLALGAAWQDHDLVFTVGHGGPIHPDNLKVDYDRLVKLAGVPRIRIHDLRHTRITLAIQQGAPIKLVSEEAGHSHVSITLGTYAHVLPAQRSEIADRLGALLFTPRAQEAVRP
jgi:integrase